MTHSIPCHSNTTLVKVKSNGGVPVRIRAIGFKYNSC